MYDWEHYVRQYKEAYPREGNGKESLKKTFRNLGLGLTFEPEAEEVKANDLQRHNIRNYPIGTVPEKVSQADGNGSIIMLTCAVDCNGLEQDARADWEVIAWSESGASYSVVHGSVGTFVPREGQKKKRDEARERWTYEWGRPLSVWPELNRIMSAKYPTDTGRKMQILMGGIDSGRYTNHVYSWVDSIKSMFRVGLKGKDEAKPMKDGADLPSFRPARERSNLYLVEVNALKDDLSERMRLRWDEGDEEKQPPGYLNFPQPGQGLYGFNNYFSHYEAEHRINEKKDDKPLGTRWVKRYAAAQNHFWDVQIYNMVLKDIVVNLVCKSMKELKGIKPSWAEFVSLFLGKK